MQKIQTNILQFVILLLTIIPIISACGGSPTPTATQPPTDPPANQLADRIIAIVDGIDTVPVAHTMPVDTGGSQALIEITTAPQYNNEDTATAIFAIALEELMTTYNVPAPIYFSLVINDGTTKTAYEHDQDTQSFIIQTVE